MTQPQAVPTDPHHAVPVSRDIAFEIAAVSKAILDTEAEKTRVAQEFTGKLKKLKKRQRELISEIESSGNAQLVMNFGSTVRTEIALAGSAPSKKENVDTKDEGLEDVEDKDDDQDDPQNFGDSDQDGATH